MADVKISALPPASTPLTGTEILPIVQGGITEQVTIANITAGRTVAAATVNVDANSASAALRITQTGAGNALLVEDSANPDASPFVVDTAGFVMAGAQTAINSSAGTPRLQSHVVGSQSFGAFSWADNTGATSVNISKSRGTSVGSYTVVQSGDDLGSLRFEGSDGAAFIRAAQINASVDGTPGTNDMPGRLVFSTTADGASSPTERMRIDSVGGVGIGATSLTGYTLRVDKNVTGATSAYGIRSGGIVQSDATVLGAGFLSALGASATTTTTAIAQFLAQQGTFTAGAAVTNQYGFWANTQLIGATNNFGFRGEIASGTGRWNFYAAGTANNAYNGNSRFGGVTAPVATVDVTGSVAATTTILSTGATSGIGYATGAGGAVTQGTSRTTGVTLDKVSGAITLFSAAGSAAYQSFTVTNSAVAATDTIILNQKSGTDKYILLVTAVAAGSFQITFATTGGTTTEQPVFNFAVIKAVAA